MILQLPWIWPLFLVILTWIAAIKDLKTYTIPHVYPFLVIASFIIGIFLVGFSFELLGWQLLSAIIAFFVGFVLFAIGAMGGGDVKLFAALALLIPLKHLGVLTVLVTFSGLFYTLAFFIWRFIRARQNPEHESWKSALKSVRKSKLPYGPAIAMGLTAYIFLTSF